MNYGVFKFFIIYSVTLSPEGLRKASQIHLLL